MSIVTKKTNNPAARESIAFSTHSGPPKPSLSSSYGSAGTKPERYYGQHLSKFRNRVRNILLPMIRSETPYLAKVQSYIRTPLLDAYFIGSANLGSHTFYILLLPIAYWFGYPEFGRALTFVLALGVYVTNVLKDFFCLPRPLSPPLHRLTMSKVSALEYGFPSTHSANSVSTFLLVAYYLRMSETQDIPVFSPAIYFLLHTLNVIYILSLMIGRIYCGMHGIFDLAGGAIVGTVIFWLAPLSLEIMKYYVWSSSYGIFLLTPIAFVLIKMQPKPADNCPCFEDSIAFLGVLIGQTAGEWLFHNSVMYLQWHEPICTVLHDKFFLSLGELKMEHLMVYQYPLRFLVGILIIVGWRVVMKKVLSTVLPPIWSQLSLILKSSTSQPFEDSKISNEDISMFTVDSTSGFKQRLTKGHPETKENVHSGQGDSHHTHLRWHDHEVITKLIVYAGIAWNVCFLTRVLFVILGI